MKDAAGAPKRGFLGRAVGGTLARYRSPWAAAPTGGIRRSCSTTKRTLGPDGSDNLRFRPGGSVHSAWVDPDAAIGMRPPPDHAFPLSGELPGKPWASTCYIPFRRPDFS